MFADVGFVPSSPLGGDSPSPPRLGSGAQGRKPHRRTAAQLKAAGTTGEKNRRGRLLVFGRRIKLGARSPQAGARRGLEATRRPTRFLPKLLQVQGAPSNLNFARPERGCKSESRLVVGLRQPRTHCQRGKSGVPAGQGPGAAPRSCALLGRWESSRRAVYPKDLPTKVKSALPGPTPRRPSTWVVLRTRVQTRACSPQGTDRCAQRPGKCSRQSHLAGCVGSADVRSLPSEARRQPGLRTPARAPG